MNKTSKTILAVALAGTVGITGISSVALARGWNNNANQAGYGMQMQQNGQAGYAMRGQRGAGGGSLLNVVCDSSAAASMETSLDTLATNLGLSDEQKPLFDAYKTAALSAQTEYADTCVIPMFGQTGDYIAMLESRQTNMAARLVAFESVLPKFEALYDTFSDAQKAAVVPTRGPANRGNAGNMGWQNQNQNVQPGYNRGQGPRMNGQYQNQPQGQFQGRQGQARGFGPGPYANQAPVTPATPTAPVTPNATN